MNDIRSTDKHILRSFPAVMVCMGLDVFMDALRKQGVEVIPVNWSPPHTPPKELKDILDQLL